MRFKTKFDPDTPDEKRKWLRALQSTGVENIRARLLQSPGGSRSVLLGISDVTHMTRGFAEEWVECKDRRARRIQRASFVVGLISAIAATIAAWPVIKEWAGTVTGIGR
jgi:hypothetical protein